MKTFYNVQFGRAVAALLVVYAHIGFPGATFGHFGVDIFFIISGFIMTMICIRSPQHFFMRRFVRIAPLYWLMTLFVLVMSYARPSLFNSTTPDIGNFIKSILFIPYIHENGLIRPMLDLGWTLNYEMYFYAVIALALMVVPAKHAALAASAGLVAIFGFLNVLLSHNLITPVWANTLAVFYSNTCIFSFILGVGAYYISQNKTAQKLGVYPGLLIAAGSLGFLIYHQIATGATGGFITQTIPCMLFVTSLLLIEKAGFVITKLTILGDASYVLYLTHLFVVEGFNKVVVKALHLPAYSIVSVVGILATTSAVAIVIFKYIEKPMHERLRKLVEN